MLRVLPIFVFLIACTMPTLHAQTVNVWFGTTGETVNLPAEGIYHATMDLKDGSISESELAIKLPSPGFLCVHPDQGAGKSVMYATTQIDGVPVIASLHIQPDGKLSILNSAPIGEGLGRACHVSTDHQGQILVASQYGSGSACVYRLNEDGSIQSRTQVLQHEGGSGVLPIQKVPRVHYCGFSPDNRYAVLCNLGQDKVYVYEVDLEKARLNEVSTADSLPGGGPRHMKFHPSGKFAFVVNELSMGLGCYRFDSETGTLKLLQTVDTITEHAMKTEVFNSGAEVRVHPSGKFVYATNRGNDTVTLFHFDEANGTLTRKQIEPIRGVWPRNFDIAPDGKWMVIAGSDSNTATVFSIDQEDGSLVYQRKIATVPHPICVTFSK